MTRLNTILATSVAALMAAGVAANAADKIKEVDVSADITAIENAEAAAYWTNVADDVENAIVALLVDRTAETGAKVSVDLSEVELSNSFTSAAGLADTKLVGTVNVTSETDNSDFDSFELTVLVDQILPLMPAGTDIMVVPRDSAEFYTAAVNAFAQATVARLSE